jgi:tetratricopeptide (TPR) repeat protein
MSRFGGSVDASYRHLDPAAARAFRLIGLHPGADIDVNGAAALIGEPLTQTSLLLDQLAKACLIHQRGPGRWGMEDLPRADAVELAGQHDGEIGKRNALTRLFDWYLAAATAAVLTAFPSDGRFHLRAAAATPGHASALRGPGAARAWLDSERANLVAVAGYACGRGWRDHSIDLATVLFRYLESCNHYQEAETLCTWARGAAGQVGDQAAEARALTDLGLICWHQGRYGRAADHLEQAARLFGLTGTRTGQAYALGNLGLAVMRLGRCEDAACHLERALSLFCQAGDHGGEAWALVNLGDVHVHLCHYRLAAGNLNKALALFKGQDNTAGEANALSNLGAVGRLEGRYLEATGHLRQALVLFRAIADRAGQAEALNGLGEVALATGKPARARAQHAAALDLAGQIGELYEQARAHRGIAEAHLADGDGDSDQARQHWRRALALYGGLGVPEADRVRDLFEPGVSSAPSAL